MAIYPNPFTNQVNIEYELERMSDVKIDIYTPLGSKIATLVDNQESTGIHRHTYQNDQDATGIYFIRIVIDDQVISKRIAKTK